MAIIALRNNNVQDNNFCTLRQTDRRSAQVLKMHKLGVCLRFDCNVVEASKNLKHCT